MTKKHSFTEAHTEILQVGQQPYRYIDLQSILAARKIKPTSLPTTIKILLENVARRVKNPQPFVDVLCDWKQHIGKKAIPYSPARVLMQDFTGVPAIVDLAAMRDALVARGGDPQQINPQCDVDLVIDHSVSVDHYGTADALTANMQIEMKRNKERYQFLKWGQQAFKNFQVVPPGNGICHQVNLEYLAQVVKLGRQDEKDAAAWAYPDTLVGTDSHTTMINALGVLGWGVGGIEAEAVMLGQPLDLLIPKVTGVYLTGELGGAITATDLVLTIAEKLRRKGVVGHFVEFYGPGVSCLSLSERATIANMSPEFGSTCAFFAVDEETLRYLRTTGRDHAEVDRVAKYCMLQGLWHQPEQEATVFSDHLAVDLSAVKACLAGPKRPQDRVALDALGLETEKTILAHGPLGGLNVKAAVKGRAYQMTHGDVVIAAITSCTNTSNPSILITAGLIAKQALALGLEIKPWVKASFAPGSKVVVAYLSELGLLEPLEQLGFHIVGYGCTTCIGNSGPLSTEISQCVQENKLHVSAVLSGNRNFEGRIHPEVTMNWLASPPLVILYALAGTTKVNLNRDVITRSGTGKAIRLSDLWPKKSIVEALQQKITSEMYKKQYAQIFVGGQQWDALSVNADPTYNWQPGSTYIQRPEFFAKPAGKVAQIRQASILALLGDSVTTDHISPAGFIPANSPAGRYLQDKQVHKREFNSYGSRRGNHNVMVRGTFANIRLQNHCVQNLTGGYTTHWPSGEILPIFEAAKRYQDEATPLVVFAGKEYGTGSSRDWAAKGTMMLGVKAVIAESFERIHRSNLVGMGVLPCQLVEHTIDDLGLDGDEKVDLLGLAALSEENQMVQLVITAVSGKTQVVPVCVRLDTRQEHLYYGDGGVLPFVLKEIMERT